MLTDPSGLFDLTGRRAVVTGGAGALGSQSALALASAGASVAVVDLDEARVRRSRTVAARPSASSRISLTRPRWSGSSRR
jgi:NAD(P)-dependent dehydrogenase (short-subunit alcohol dehydrogenase family)